MMIYRQLLIACAALATLLISAIRAGAEDQTITPPPGDYRMVDLLLKGAGDKHADLWLRGATRNGRVPVASRNSVRDIISEWIVDTGSIHGEFPLITSFGGATSSSKDLSIRLIEIATGKVLWERIGISSEQVKPWSGARNMCTSPIYAGGTLIMPDHGTALTGIDPATGKDLWKLKDKSYGFQVPAKWMHQGQEYVLSMFQTGGGKGFFSASAACIEPKTGKILWEIALPPNPSKGVIVHGDTMYVISGGITTPSEDGTKALCTAFRLDLTKAEQLWQTTTPDANAHPVAACNGRYVVVKGTTKRSHLLDAATGNILATYQGDTGQNECHAAMIEDTVIMSRDGSHGRSDMTILGGIPETFGKLRCFWNQPHPQTTSYHNKYMTWPMVEGRIFMRGFDGVYCYDLRKTLCTPRTKGPVSGQQ